MAFVIWTMRTRINGSLGSSQDMVWEYAGDDAVDVIDSGVATGVTLLADGDELEIETDYGDAVAGGNLVVVSFKGVRISSLTLGGGS